MSAKAALFRKKFLLGLEPIRIVGAHDGLGAQLIERHGFDGVWASGLEISASFGVPDANILTMTQYLERAQEMNTASNLPVFADVDTGYGNSSNVHYLVQQYEAAGIAGIAMEDKLFPKVNSFVPGRQELASIPEFCGKIAAAKDAQTGDDFLVIARVEALIAGWGQEEALRRSEAYADAGADGILIHSKSKEPDEIRAFLKAWKKRAPIVLVPTTYPGLLYEEMGDLGVHMVIYANQCLRAAIKAMHGTLEHIQTKRSTAAIEASLTPVKEIFELQGMMKLKEHEKKYLRTQKTIHAIIPAGGAPNHEGAMVKLLKDAPIAMLDTDGKPLLQRIVESLHLAGIQDVTVVTGYQGDKVHIEGVDKRHNDAFMTKGILHSIALAEDKWKDSVLLHYGDVIVSPENLQSFTSSDDAIAIMISPLLREGRYEKKKFERVALHHPRSASQRTLERHPRNELTGIGKDLAPDRSDGEFIGLVLLNPQGIPLWKKTVAGLSAEERDTMSLHALLQRMVDAGIAITTFEARTGWAEVHSVEDLEQLCTLLRTQ